MSGPYTSHYSDEARRRLGTATENARRLLGHDTRPGWAKVCRVSVRSVEKLELGEKGVGPAVLHRVQRALGWEPDAARAILEGGPSPRAETEAAVALRGHTRRDLRGLLGSDEPPRVVLARLTIWHDHFRDTGLSAEDLLTLVRATLAERP